MRRLVIPYTPRPLQLRVHEARTRFCVLVCHRRFGKTVLAINDLIRQAVRSGQADWRAAYAAPFYGQAKAVAWDYLRHFAGVIPGTRFSESELRCDLPTGARIRLYGTDNPNALRGIYLDDLVLDEPADMGRDVWAKVLRPTLADRQGRVLFVGTPNGTQNLLYDVWEQAAGEDPAWSRFAFRASETGYLNAEELEKARADMSEEEYAQEFECSFAAAMRGAYYGPICDRLEREGRITRVTPDPALLVHTAWDLGMDDATAIWFFQIEPSGDWRCIDYYEAEGEGLAHYASVLTARGYAYGRHIAPHDIRVRELGNGKSRLDAARDLGIRFDIAPNLPLADGIQAVRQHLPRMWFDADRCAAGIKALRHYRKAWRPRQEMFSSTPLHDWTSHTADALRYAVLGMRPERHEPRQAQTHNHNPRGW